MRYSLYVGCFLTDNGYDTKIHYTFNKSNALHEIPYIPGYSNEAPRWKTKKEALSFLEDVIKEWEFKYQTPFLHYFNSSIHIYEEDYLDI